MLALGAAIQASTSFAQSGLGTANRVEPLKSAASGLSPLGTENVAPQNLPLRNLPLDSQAAASNSTAINPAPSNTAPNVPAPNGLSQPIVQAAPVIDPLTTANLTLADVIASVTQSFPVIEQARLQGGVATGEVVSANGFYDHKLQGYTLSDPTGVYRNYRQSIGLARQLWWGGYLSAGYRLGRGDFEPWYKERETDKSGEFKLGLTQPLLQGRAIDPARVALFQANLRQQAVAPEIERAVLAYALEGAQQYWNWVAAGGTLEAQRELLELAETRTKQLEDLVKAGKNKAVDLLVNEQLVAERKLNLIAAEQKYRATSFKLSLYLRDEAGQPMVPSDDWLPRQFPTVQPLLPGDFQSDFSAAMLARPEPRLISLEIQQVSWDNRLARNQTLPQLDLITEGSQDAGDPASSSNDKSRFELEVGLQGELPIQRRKARGKIQSTNAKLAQLQQKLRWQQDKIGAELQTARNALDLANQSVAQAEAALRSAITTVDRYNFAYTEGKVDLVYLNLLETKANEYEIKLIESQSKWFAALAEMQAALGIDPIEQSILISNLPPASTPAPRRLPEPLKDKNNEAKAVP